MTAARSCGDLAGTHRGVNGHNRAWEPLCEECRRFRAAYARARRQSDDEKEKSRRASARQRWAVKRLIARHRSEYADLLARSRQVLP